MTRSLRHVQPPSVIVPIPHNRGCCATFKEKIFGQQTDIRTCFALSHSSLLRKLHLVHITLLLSVHRQHIRKLFLADLLVQLFVYLCTDNSLATKCPAQVNQQECMSAVFIQLCSELLAHSNLQIHTFCGIMQL